MKIKFYYIITYAYFINPLIPIRIIRCNKGPLPRMHLMPLNHTFLPRTLHPLILLSFIENLLILSQRFLLVVMPHILQIFQMLLIHLLRDVPLSLEVHLTFLLMFLFQC